MKSLLLFCACLLPLSAATVNLDVVVNDKSGKAVTGLEQQDFTVLDNKHPQNITSFQPDNGNDAEVTLVIDAVNADFSRVGYEREQIIKFLQRDAGRLSAPVTLAIFTDTGLRVLGPASRDGSALIALLNQNDTALRSLRRSAGFYGAAERSQLSLKALGQLAESASREPGHKILVWVSPGWPILSGPNVQLTQKDQRGIFTTVVGLSTQLREARITLYDVNPLGSSENLLRENYYEQFLKGVKKESDVQFGDLSLQVLSAQSGGRVLDGSNDLAAGIETCFQDAKADYVVAFESADANGYHPLEIKLSRSGLKAQTRSGYYSGESLPQSSSR